MILFNVLLASSFISQGASVQTETPAEIGSHYRLFTFEKNENPQNIMVIYSKLDAKCHFLENPKNHRLPFFDFYWLMDKTRYKPVHPLIKSGIRNRLEVYVPVDYAKNKNHFFVKINELKKIDKSLQSTSLEISAGTSNGHCEVKTVFHTTPNDSKSVFEVEKIYSESEKTWIPPFRRVLSLTISGVDPQTQKIVEKKYSSTK